MQIKQNEGITLIALIVTIIVLLILAGISIAMLTGQNGILNRTAEAKEKTEAAQKDEDEKLQGYESTIDKYAYGVPEGLEVGSTVSYSPSGTYNWQSKYCSTTQTEDVTLSSESGKDFNLTEWKVLSIENGKAEMVPTEPTKGTVYLGETQGYNNGVKLLNDVCSNLYSSNGVTARSLNIDDIEKYMSEDKLTEVHSFTNYARYGEQIPLEYTNNKNFPSIYAKEKLSIINGESVKGENLNRSQQTSFIEKDDNGATYGRFTAEKGILPYQTYWSKDASYMKEAFKIASRDVNYYNLLIKETSAYWLASRSINTYSDYCDFNVCCVYYGSMNAFYTYGSGNGTHGTSFALFPVISLNASSITGDATNGFTVKVN